ncbi:DNA topoisomerase [Vibrio rotiferianus]|uniref:DNA topoisomerase n=1 Tax=Vibrio rotiferianus TaxID=190895 RepID=UPI0005EE6DCD|nr:DNA topoisomerase [Vibrio rotiferianus]
MKLYLCEKPSQAEAIAEFLGMTALHKKKGHYIKDNIAVTWAVGHIFELQPPEHYQEKIKKGWDLSLLPIVPDKFEYNLKDNFKGQFKTIKGLLRKANEVFIATDPDPEGERIARTILKFASYKGDLYRVLYSGTDSATLTKAFSSPIPASETEWMERVSTARSNGDWLVGMNLTMALSTLERSKSKEKHKGAFRSGRVKTPICMLVFYREQAIQNFVPKEYYELEVVTQTESGDDLVLEWQIPSNFLDADSEKLLDPNVVNRVVQYIKQLPSGTITSVVEEEKSVQPPLPFSQTGLQISCGKYGLEAQETLDICQSLYAQPLSNQTYPRTGIQHLPEGMFEEAPKTISHLLNLPALKNFSSSVDVNKKSKAWNDKKVEVHHGIIPTSKEIDFDLFTEKQKLVFLVVAKRYLSQFSDDFVYKKTTITAQFGNLKFQAIGRVPISSGWKAIEKEDKTSTDVFLPNAKARSLLKIIDVRVLTKKTKAPSRYTTTSLVQAASNIAGEIDDPELKKLLRKSDGLGTEATRAGLVDDCIKSGLVVVKNGKLWCSPRFIKMQPFIPDDLKNPATSALWERAFEGIKSNKITVQEFTQLQSKFVESCLKSIVSESTKKRSSNRQRRDKVNG